MGYTHYWRRPVNLDAAKFKAVADDLTKLLPKLPKLFGPDGRGTPVINEKKIIFNGDRSKNEDHETFYIASVFGRESIDVRPHSPMKFAFCKTARKPYDIAVCATLLLLKHHFENDIQVSSDGRTEDWQSAINLIGQEFGYGSRWEFSDTERQLTKVA